MAPTQAALSRKRVRGLKSPARNDVTRVLIEEKLMIRKVAFTKLVIPRDDVVKDVGEAMAQLDGW